MLVGLSPRITFSMFLLASFPSISNYRPLFEKRVGSNSTWKNSLRYHTFFLTVVGKLNLDIRLATVLIVISYFVSSIVAGLPSSLLGMSSSLKIAKVWVLAVSFDRSMLNLVILLNPNVLIQFLLSTAII